MTRRSLLVLPLLMLAACGTAPPDLPPAADAAIEAVGGNMGYRIFGEARKNRAVLLQNSRPHPVEVFDRQRGVFVQIPPYSDLEMSCTGERRTLDVRYPDTFRESVPFQCASSAVAEIQFVAPQQVAPPRPAEVVPAPAETPPAAAP